MAQRKANCSTAYENWKKKVVNKKGEFYPKKDKDGLPVKGNARYLITVINRVRDTKGKKEYLTSKGWLEGFNESGRLERFWCAWPEIHRHTEFVYERYYNEKSGAYIEYTTGPNPSECYDVYSLDFNEANVRKLFAQTDQEEVEFNVKDLKTSESKRVEWSSVKESLNLFIHKSFDFLMKSEFIPMPVRMELRQQAVAEGLIKGVGSDYMQSSNSSAGVE